MSHTRRSRRVLLAAVAAAVAFAALTGVALSAYFKMESRTFDNAAVHTEHVTKSDATLVRYWLDRREVDVFSFSTASRVGTEFSNFLAGDVAAETWLNERLEAERVTRDYVGMSVFTVEGERVLSFGEEDSVTGEELSAIARSVAVPTADVAMTSRPGASGSHRVLWFAPLLVDDAGTEPAVTGVIMYEADLQRYLQDVIEPEMEPWPTVVEIRVTENGHTSVARSDSGFAFRTPSESGGTAGEVVKSTVALPWKGASISATVRGADIRSELGWERQSVRLGNILVLIVFVLFLWAYAAAEKNRLAEIAAREAIADALATQDRFLENMSHELRTPLNSVIGFSSLMRRGLAGDVNEEQVLQLSMIEASGKHLLALVTDVLDLSRTKAGEEDVRPEWVVASEPVGFVSGVLAPSVAEKGLEWRVEVPADLELRTDRRLLERILLNLASNAVKFAHEGSVTIAAAVGPDDEVAFTVRDSGCGISSESLDDIMQEFKQLREPGFVKPEGFGLGLSISTTTAALLGGRIDVESTPGEGSVFTLVLPRNAGAVS